MKKLLIPFIALLAILSNAGCTEKKKDKTAQNAILLLALSSSSASDLRASLGARTPLSSGTGYGICEMLANSASVSSSCIYYYSEYQCYILKTVNGGYHTINFYSRSTTTTAEQQGKTTCNKLGYTDCSSSAVIGTSYGCVKP